MNGSQLLWANAMHYAELKHKFAREGATDSAEMYGQVAETYRKFAELAEFCEAQRTAA